MYTTSAKRKLLPRSTLSSIFDLTDIGVPLAKVLRDKDLDACRPVISKLLDSYALATRDDVMTKIRSRVFASLFPLWLEERPEIQEQPDGWKYRGRFPTGRWLNPDIISLQKELENEND
jgi:hypothetical protein